MRHFIAYIFLTLFSFQVLPVKEIGKMLFKSQTTEEIHEEDFTDNGPDAKLKKEGDPFRPAADFSIASSARIQSLSAKIAVVIHRTAILPDYHIPDILTPPPNQA
jgi:hypothetical protein